MSACPECPGHLEPLYEVGFLRRGSGADDRLVDVVHVLLEAGATPEEISATTTFDERRALIRALVPDPDRTRLTIADAAEQAGTTALVNARDVLARSGGSEADLLRLEQAGLDVLDLVAGVLTRLFWRHMEAAIAAQDGRELPEAADVRELVVGFIDLVGFTLGELLATFEDAVVSNGAEHGCRVVKFIGDEAMLVATEVPSIVRVIRAVATVVDRQPELSGIRAAVTAGAVLLQGGDYFGRPVNAAARALGVGGSGRIVMTRGSLDASGEHGATDLGEQQLKGFDEPVRLFAVPIDRDGVAG